MTALYMRSRIIAPVLVLVIAGAALLTVDGSVESTTPPAAAASAASSTPLAVAAAPAPAVKVFANHDAIVIETKPNLNTGSWKSLTARTAPDHVSLLKFLVPAGTPSVTGATLRLHVDSDVDTRIKVYRASKVWNEATVTYATAPQIRNKSFGAHTIKSGQRWVDIDVSSYVDGPGKYSFAVVGLKKRKLTATSSEGTARPRLMLASRPAPQDQPEPPITAAFMYPWFPNAWDQGGQIPFSQFTPSMGLYDSSSPDVIDEQVSLATGAGLEVFINSWWGRGHHTDSATMAVLNRIPQSPNPNFRVAVYYEEEGQSDPSAAAIKADLDYLERFFKKPSYLRVDGKPVVFVWAESGDGAGMAARWKEAKNRYGGDVHIVLKVFSGYRDVGAQPDSWHQYGPAKNYSEHLPHSATVSPGFWHAEDASPRLARNVNRFRNDVEAMAASGAFWQLITTWNEWGEGTIVEPSKEFGTTYLDILEEELGGAGAPPPPPPPEPPPAGDSVTFAAGGDFGATSRTDATFESIAASNAAFLLALGDLSYDDATPSEWCAYVKGHLGNRFPVQLLVGNHEDDDRVDGYILDFAKCLPDRMGSSGVYGAEYFFDVDGLARFIMVGAGNDVGGEKYDYERGNAHYKWLENTIDDARDRGIPWIVIGMHKPCITAGSKSCEVGKDVYDLLIDKRVDLILHGHDHDYQRSKQLRCVTVDSYDAGCVVDHGGDGKYRKGAGSVFAVVGNTGGGGLTSIDTGDSEIGYIAQWHGENSPDPGRGYALIEVSANGLDFRFVGTTTSYSDSFSID